MKNNFRKIINLLLILLVCVLLFPAFQKTIKAESEYDRLIDMRSGDKEVPLTFDGSKTSYMLKFLIAAGEGSFDVFPFSTGYDFYNYTDYPDESTSELFVQYVKIDRAYGGNVTYDMKLSGSDK